MINGHAGIDPTHQYTGSAADYEDIFGRDLFETLFSGLFRSSDISHGQDISVSRGIAGCIATGGDLEVTYRRLSRCNSCDGSGCKTRCKACSMPNLWWCGHVRGQGFFSLPRTCGTCRGRGTVVTDPCLKCQGAGRAKVPGHFAGAGPLGMTDGYRLRVDGEGHEGTGGGQKWGPVRVDFTQSA